MSSDLQRDNNVKQNDMESAALLASQDKDIIDQSIMSQKESPERPKYYVGLGASAGGLEALQAFFSNMPPNTGMAFVVVQHLSPDFKSLMVELLSKHTEMPVVRTTDRVTIKPNTIYLIPPKKNMEVYGGNLYLSEQPDRHSLNLPIDVFFNSLADDRGEKAIAVVLSGTGSDGTRGVRAIKEAGGMVFVQESDSAKFDGMPKSALATGVADVVLPPEKMPQALITFASHPFASRSLPGQETLSHEENGLKRLLNVLHKATKVDFSHYKPATVVRRIERRMGIVQSRSLEDYVALISSDPKELSILFRDLLIGVTRFFRDKASFNILATTIIPQIYSNALDRGSKDIRIWVPGCSTGEEAYSLSMLFHQHKKDIQSDIEVKIFATDIDQNAIERAGVGLFPESIAADVDTAFLQSFFEKNGAYYKAQRFIRESIVFAAHNLINDPPFTKLDFISCRNLLIYLQPVLQRRVLSVFNYALLSNGYLFLGSSESVGEFSEAFTTFNPRHRIYQHNGKGTLPLRDSIVEHGSQPFSFSFDTISERNDRYAASRVLERNEAYYHALISKTALTVFVVDENRRLLQSFGDAKLFLDFPPGNINLDILTMLPRELSLAASSGLHKTAKERKPAHYMSIRCRINDVLNLVDLTVDFMHDSIDDSNRFLIIIERSREATSDESKDDSNQDQSRSDKRIADLEQEVQLTRENLQAAIEELQTSNEELQATNEELLAANEELQSTNEELQSVNEELNTVNTEYQEKNLELTALNNDIKSLMESTEIGAIFLDRDLKIRKFTPAVTQVIKLINQDAGRPLTDLSSVVLGDIVTDIEQVMNTGEMLERNVDMELRSYILRVLPFRNDRGKIEGSVIILIDVTKRRRAEQALKRQFEFLERILANSPSAQVMVDQQGAIVFANANALKIFNRSREALLGLQIEDLKLAVKDIDDVPLEQETSPFTLIQKTRDKIERYIVSLPGESGGKTVYSVTGSPLFDAVGEVDGAVLSFEIIAHDA
ncbi:chemotaxis protein CheB [Desulfovibrio inopinatus]|uniref:chemotaxis protein CheB n=1 Tax=Desulfovibrio inopinatus TaxID=102109 RepID=UPI0003FA7E8B|nr:chemotaxis protein CheB [Desulfovibrio inopinatus]